MQVNSYGFERYVKARLVSLRLTEFLNSSMYHCTVHRNTNIEIDHTCKSSSHVNERYPSVRRDA
jgi:hypothetical protein